MLFKHGTFERLINGNPWTTYDALPSDSDRLMEEIFRKFIPRSYFWAFVAVFIWSTAATVGAVLEGRANALQIVVIMQISAIVTLAYRVSSFHRPVDVIRIHARRLLRNYKALSVQLLMSIFITAYHIAFYYSIQNAPNIQANILNYIWPIILYFVASKFANRVRPSLYDVSLVTLSFAGATLIAWDPTTNSLPNFSESPFLLLALFAAFCAPVYMQSSIYLSSFYRGRTELPYLYSFLLSLGPLVVILALIDDAPAMDGVAIVFSIYLGVFSIAIGHVAWTRALTLGGPIMASSAYFVPVLSTVFLVVIVGDTPSRQVALGVVVIIVANVLTNPYFRELRAESAAVVAFFFFAVIIYMQDELQLRGSVAPVQYLGEAFAVISGFLISRLWQKNQEEEIALFKFSSRLTELATKREEDAGHDFDEIAEIVLAIDASRDRLEVENHIHRLQKHVFARDCEVPLSNDRRFVENMNNWLARKVDRTSIGEFLIVLALGFASAAVVVTSAKQSLLGDAVALTFCSCIAYIVFKIRDYDLASVMNAPIKNRLMRIGVVDDKLEDPDVELRYRSRRLIWALVSTAVVVILILFVSEYS